MLGLVLWTALSQMDLIMILTCRIKFLMMPLVVTKSQVHYRKISQDLATNNYGFRLLDFCGTVEVAVVNGRAGSDASTVYVKMSVLLIMRWCRRICFH